MNLIEDLKIQIDRCEQYENVLEQMPCKAILDAWLDAVISIRNCWSNSSLGYQAKIYYQNFEKPPQGERFDGTRTNLFGPVNSPRWIEYDFKQVENEINKRAGFPDYKIIDSKIKELEKVFTEAKVETISILDALLSVKSDARTSELREEINKLKACTPRGDF